MTRDFVCPTCRYVKCRCPLADEPTMNADDVRTDDDYRAWYEAAIKTVSDALWAELVRYPQANPNRWAVVALAALGEADYLDWRRKPRHNDGEMAP